MSEVQLDHKSDFIYFIPYINQPSSCVFPASLFCSPTLKKKTLPFVKLSRKKKKKRVSTYFLEWMVKMDDLGIPPFKEISI